MADSLTPWFYDYFLNTAETYGAQLASVPLYVKNKKVQIIEFLTFGSDEQDTYIWARISDKQYMIPVKFTKEAVADFRNLTSRRLTQHKGAIVTIKQFKCMSSRLPLDGGKSTKQSYLALECESVSLLGSSGESAFGNPKLLATNPDMHIWSEALNQAGGAGNILKERKEQRDQEADKVRAVSLDSMPPPPLPPPLSPRSQSGFKPIENVLPARKKYEITDMAAYNAQWQAVEKHVYYRHPPEETKPQNIEIAKLPDAPVRNKTTAQEEQPDVESINSRSRSATPITTWERSSPAIESELLSNDKPTASSRLIPPTPAQRTKRQDYTPNLSSSFPVGAESILGIETDSPDHGNASQVLPLMSRKVPRPISPQPHRHTGRVLAPNSDTSGTQSQSLSLTQQSQSLSQSQPQQGGRVALNSSNKALQPVNEETREDTDDDMAMQVDHEDEDGEDEKRRGSVILSPEAALKRESSSPEKSVENGGERDVESNVGSTGIGTDTEADGSDDGYPWMTLWNVRGVIVKADGLRGRLHNDVVT